MHATHFSKPNEQTKSVQARSKKVQLLTWRTRRIMKIACLIPFYSIFSLLSICLPKADISFSPWLDVVQALALGSFFLLMCEFVSESPAERDVFFAALVVRDEKRPSIGGGGLLWYRVSCSFSVQNFNSYILT